MFPVERQVGRTPALWLRSERVECKLLGGRTGTSVTQPVSHLAWYSHLTPGLPGEYLVAELGWRPVYQLPTVLTAGVAVLVSPGGSDHKAQAQLGI